MSEAKPPSTGQSIVKKTGHVMMEAGGYWQEMCEDPKKAGKHLLTILQLMPGGGIVRNNIVEYIANKKAERIEKVLRALAAGIRRIEDRIDPSYLASDEFTHLLVEAILKAQYEHRETKLKMLGYTVAHMAGDGRYTFDQKEFLLNIVAEMGEHHVEILEQLHKVGVVTVVDVRGSARTMLDCWQETRSLANLPREQSSLIFISSSEWLESRGLMTRLQPIDGGIGDANDQQRRETVMRASRCSITELGMDLHAMIESQGEEAPATGA